MARSQALEKAPQAGSPPAPPWGVMEAEEARRRRDWMGFVLAGFERRLRMAAPSERAPPHDLHAAMRHILLAPSKRTRALLAVFVSEALNADEEAAMDVACVIEFVHAASLLLDDLPCMDDAARRRGRPCAHLVYGEAVATLAAVALLNLAFATLAHLPNTSDSVRVGLGAKLAEVVGSGGLIGGQVADLAPVAGRTIAEAEAINRRKTAVLFEFAVTAAAALAGADTARCAHLTRYADALGLAFQLLDDLRDAGVVTPDAGKDCGKDAGKLTVAALSGTEEARARLTAHLETAWAALGEAGAATPALEALMQLCFADVFA